MWVNNICTRSKAQLRLFGSATREEINGSVPFLAAEQLAAFAAVVEQMLEDVQERLVYRTHIYIQTDIVGYKPAPGDLAYPAKLEMMEVRLSPSVVAGGATQEYLYQPF